MSNELCFKCNGPTKYKHKHMFCTMCDEWLRDCPCKPIPIEIKEEPLQIRSRFEVIGHTGKIKKKRKKFAMSDKFYETVKYLFDWTEYTKIMLMVLGAIAACTIGGIECGRYNIASDKLKNDRDHAIIQLQQECIKSQRPVAECQNFK